MTDGARMNIDLARHMVRVAFRAGRELEGALAALKQGCPPEEYRDLACGIAAAIDGINVALIDRGVAADPDLEAEIEEAIGRYGRYL